MTAPTDLAVHAAVARNTACRLLSHAFLYPEADTAHRSAELADALAVGAAEQGWPQVSRGAEAVRDHMRRMTVDMLVADYVRVFGHSVSDDCPQYEAEYHQAHIFQKSETLADLDAFYRAFGMAVSPDFKDRLDHVSVEMEFLGLLALKEAHAIASGHGADRVEVCRDAQSRFLALHLANWTKSFVARVVRRAGGDTAYTAVATLLDAYVDNECERFGVAASPARPPAAVALSAVTTGAVPGPGRTHFAEEHRAQ